MADVPATREVLDSGKLVILDDVLNFDPFTRPTVADALQQYTYMLSNYNRLGLYIAYTMGKLVDARKLRAKWGIESITALAAMMHTTTNTLHRYRHVYELLTPAQVQYLTRRNVSVNAVIEIVRIKRDHPEEAEQLLEMLLNGEDIHVAKEVSEAYINLLTSRLQPNNLLPGAGEPPEEATASDRAAVADVIAEASSPDPKTPAEAVLADSGSPVSGEERVIPEDKETSLNVKDVKAVYNAVRTSAVALRRVLRDIRENAEEQLNKIIEKDSVILGHEETHEEYAQLCSDIYDDILGTTESLIKEVMRGQQYGYIRRAILLPESANTEELFRTES